MIIFKNNLNLLLIRKLATKSGLFTIKFCLKKKTIQYKYYLQFISIKKTHIVPIKKFISIKNRYSNTNTNSTNNNYKKHQKVNKKIKKLFKNNNSN